MNDDNIKQVFFINDINDIPIKKTKLKIPNDKPIKKRTTKNKTKKEKIIIEPIKNVINFVITFDDI